MRKILYASSCFLLRTKSSTIFFLFSFFFSKISFRRSRLPSFPVRHDARVQDVRIHVYQIPRLLLQFPFLDFGADYHGVWRLGHRRQEFRQEYRPRPWWSRRYIRIGRFRIPRYLIFLNSHDLTIPLILKKWIQSWPFTSQKMYAFSPSLFWFWAASSWWLGFSAAVVPLGRVNAVSASFSSFSSSASSSPWLLEVG